MWLHEDSEYSKESRGLAVSAGTPRARGSIPVRSPDGYPAPVDQGGWCSVRYAIVTIDTCFRPLGCPTPPSHCLTVEGYMSCMELAELASKEARYRRVNQTTVHDISLSANLGQTRYERAGLVGRALARW